jgi:hypothetical protein
MADLASLTFKVPSRWNIQALVDTELHMDFSYFAVGISTL